MVGQYLPTFWTTLTEDLDDYVGGWTPGHLWFILFLLVFSLAGAARCSCGCDRGGGQRVVDAVRGRLSQSRDCVIVRARC